MRKNESKNGLFGPRDWRSEARNRGYYELLIVGAVIIGLITVGLFVYFVAVPLVAKDFKKDDGPTVIRQNQRDGDVVKERENLYGIVNEYLFKIRYINQPMMTDKELICSGGIDGAGNPLLSRIYLYTFVDEHNLQVSDTEIKAVNDNIFYPKVNDNYIVYVDAGKSGNGGGIYCYNRKEKKSALVKEFFGAIPEIHFSNNKIIWFEQVTGEIASVYVYDIGSNRLTAVNTQYQLPFVFGGIGVDGNKIVWAGLCDKDKTAEDFENSGKNQIYILDMGTGQIDKYNPDMFVFKPRIKGNIIGWLDTNGSSNASLYIVENGGAKKKLAEGVTNYYIGDGVVVYCQRERMFCYFVGKNKVLPLTKEDKRVIMIGGENGVVFWYDITQKYERDIVKNAKVDADSWHE